MSDLDHVKTEEQLDNQEQIDLLQHRADHLKGLFNSAVATE